MDYDYKAQVVMEQPYGGDATSKALSAMRELEGWCTEQKALILMDMIEISKPQVVVEIGVFGGKSLVPMAFAMEENGIGKIYGIDPWSMKASVAEMDEANRKWWAQVNYEKILHDLMTKIRKYNLQNRIELIRKTSEEAPLIPDIDILHIDGNHSKKNSCFDLEKWTPLVKTGGYIIFDDIYWGTTCEAVAWLDENCTRIADYSENCGWGIWVKR